ncbi:MAG: 23S rRNA (adenine(2503)-C(2))-methyltransferase RlmN [Oscillospiraceae bacterium]|nr:23S rRNA (adenine(2503)-C(2))-methyltransferase RlmN [Oscillospiraceae bacterium]
MEQQKIDILSLSKEELTAELVAMGEKAFRAKQIYEWLHVKKVSDFSQMSNISAQLRDELERKFCLKSLIIKKRLVSDIDNTVKYLYGLPDGESVETVLMEYKHGNSLCISTQVGCRMGCRFCASTIAGFVRHLLPSEMLLQIYETERDSGRRVDSIVLMGIGEPLDNFDNVMKFLSLLNSEGEGMSLRHISLSTCGIVDRIYELAEMKTGLTLSISLHAATDEKRSSIMPINKKYDLEQLMTACRHYFKKTGRRISFEYSLIEGVNDTEQSANELIKLLKGMLCHVNLIPINEIRERDFRKSRFVERFRKRLTDAGINATVRRTLGADINAACGQLRREDKEHVKSQEAVSE